MSYMAYTTFVVCFLAIWAVNGMPKGQGDKNGEKGDDDVICRDMDINCKAYTNKTYLCKDASWYMNCRKTCGLCTSSDDSDIIIIPGEITCTVSNVTFPAGMAVSVGCESYYCLDYGAATIKSIYCNKFELPSTCEWKSPAVKKCCPVPHCPDGIEIPYPKWWVQQ